MTPICPICNSQEFNDFRGRIRAKCAKCHALERHRFAWTVYQKYGLLDPSSRKLSVLHLAPEKFLYTRFRDLPHLVYKAVDADPSRYPYGDVQRLVLPEGFSGLEPRSCDFIIHNHVLEHIPGHWKDHFQRFLERLTIGGRMIFTIPRASETKGTEEGGELLESDAARVQRFGQSDHFRRFGTDLIPFLGQLPGCTVELNTPTPEEDARFGLRHATDPVFVMSRVSRS